MKKVLCLIFAAVMVLSLAACGGDGGSGGSGDTVKAPEGFRAGYGKENITPQYTVHLQGGTWSERKSTGIFDYIYATCIALSQGEDTVLLYTLDMKLTTDNYIDPAKEAVSLATGVPQENILFNATHTHSSVAVRYQWDGVEKYKEEFNAAVVKAAQAAIADLSEAEIYGGGIATEGLNFVRHYIMNDDTIAGSNFGNLTSGYKSHIRDADNELQMVKLQRAAEDKADIVLMTFPTHSTFNEHGTHISADLSSEARKLLEDNGYLPAYFMAASGDQVPSSKIPGLSTGDYRDYGKKLGQYALDGLTGLTKLDSTGMKLTTKTFTAPTNKEDLDKLPQAQEVKALADQYGSSSAQVAAAVKEYGFASRIQANWVVTRSRLSETMSMDLRVLNIGDLAFVLAPYEMFGQHGMEIKEKSPFATTLIITCSEGSFNYLPTEEAFEYGCYESHCSYFERGTGEKLVTEYLDILGQHKSA